MKMPASTEPTKPTQLPIKFKDYIQIRKKHEKDISFNYPPEIKLICRYSGSAVAANRSCGNVIIMMAGRTGAGKSTTINKLFDDDDLCETSNNTSGTESVWEVEAPINLSSCKPIVKTSLVFVDIPGTLDVDEKRRKSNQAIIAKYLRTTEYLTPRPTRILDALDGIVPPKKKMFARIVSDTTRLPEGNNKSRKVFPNLVLLTVNANDNRMIGSDSDLHKTLGMLKELHVVDRERPNLIVVATFAGSLPKNQYAETTKKIADDICQLLVEVFEMQRLENSRVIFIENNPVGYDLKKQENSDFYLLPDNTLSHFNLIQAIVDTCQANGDLLAMHACGSYFGNKTSVEQKIKANLTERMTYAQLGTDEEEEKAEAEARAIDKMKLQLVRELPLLFLGHGFCPSTEIRKCNTVIKRENGKQITLRGSKQTYTTHSRFKHVQEQQTTFVRLSQETKEAYEIKRADSYGLEAEMKFKIKDSVGADGKWDLEHDESNDDLHIVTFLYEWRIVRLQIEEPKKCLSEELLTALKDLPIQFDESDLTTKSEFHKFFGEWGTHFIRELYLGGSIKVLLELPSSNAANSSLDSEAKMRKLEELFNFYRENISKKTPSTEVSVDNEFSNCTIKIFGGAPPAITQLGQLTPNVLKEWIQSINAHPAELEHSMKLDSYYQIIEGPQQASLQLATADYLQCDEAVLSLIRANISDAICSSAMYDEYDDYDDDEIAENVFTGIGIVGGVITLVLLAPIWLPFYGGYKLLKRIKKAIK